jgi:hypothetical protein
MELRKSDFLEMVRGLTSHSSADHLVFRKMRSESRQASTFSLLVLFGTCAVLPGCTISDVKRYDVTDHSGKVHQDLSMEYGAEGCTHFEDRNGKTYIFSGPFTATQRK